ncbi:putative serine C-palmitoyltransferase [Rosa chinensis]|uniref:serine C-palmitoyltransferase n=1 Tax=Rosa chinensis TaxID=74649 RepID=A0A2P6QP10_ROSCH|nr:putative serine C-palmitoyltransferase [Rosa chinensis]
MGHALAAEGGFCTGSARVTDHQRLSSSGYVFSASLPPYLASAAITAIDVLEENPDLITKLKKNITYVTMESSVLDLIFHVHVCSSWFDIARPV